GYIEIYPESLPAQKKIIPFSLDSMHVPFVIIAIDHLAPDTKYNYAVINGEYQEQYGVGGPLLLFNGTFKTFPAESKRGNFTFVFGSCSENYRNDSVFVEMQKH